MSDLLGRLQRVDLSPLQRACGEHDERLGRACVKALQDKGFQAAFCRTAAEARDWVLERTPSGAGVGVGGSITIRELGLMEVLAERGHRVLHHWEAGLGAEESMRLRREAAAADVYLTGSNAVTLDGALVNIDGAGNRVAAMIFGPGRVIVIAGINKVTGDVTAALERIRNVAAPRNAIRYGAKTPCAELGYCTDCDSPDRLCRVITIIDRQPIQGDIHVCLVGETLGY